jgi:hypothetical protein
MVQGEQAFLMAEMQPGVRLQAGDHLGQRGGGLVTSPVKRTVRK